VQAGHLDPPELDATDVDGVLQNLKSVEVTFLSPHGNLPLAVLLLLVAVLGALIVFAFGAARIVQLRVAARRSRRET
jgi:uncharacterized integral membrane protein